LYAPSAKQNIPCVKHHHKERLFNARMSLVTGRKRLQTSSGIKKSLKIPASLHPSKHLYRPLHRLKPRNPQVRSRESSPF